MEIIKLKDCCVTYIGSSLTTENIYDFYGTNTRAVHEIAFYFDDNTKTQIFEVAESYGDFTTLISFFFGKDFSDVTKEDFVKTFCEFVCLDTSNIKFINCNSNKN